MSDPTSPPIRDSRRVPGPSLWNEGPAILLDLHAPDSGRAVEAWHAALDALLAVCPVPGMGRRCVRIYEGGATVGFEAPPSVLYDAIDVNELAAEVALGLRTLDAAVARARRIAPDLAVAHDAALDALAAEGMRRRVNVLVGEGRLALGSGPSAHIVALGALPPPGDVPWDRVRDVPTALVTGTNGKTTTTRLVARMLRLAGHTAGLASTEGAYVGDEALVDGDFAGPEGARRVLRDPRTTAAVLETSRGGLLRRGLSLQHATVAAVTNVGPDHFGEYGILTVEDIARAKLAVRKALPRGAPLVVNADDPVLWAEALATGHTPLWPFSLDANTEAVREATMHARSAFVRDGEVVVAGHGWELRVCGVDEMPLAFGGAASYNVQNALAAALIAVALGVPLEGPEDGPERCTGPIAEALRTFGASPTDNPGRMAVHRVALDGGEATVVVDYGHNDAGIRAARPVLATLGGTRRRVLISQAGDRSDADNARMAAEIMAIGPAEVAITELPGYERGRAAGETSESLARGFEAHGLTRARMHFSARPLDGARHLLGTLREGDVVVLFLHQDRRPVDALLDGLHHKQP